MHHVAVDGMAGQGIMSLLFDMTPEPRKIEKPKPFRPKPIPNEMAMMFKSALSFTKDPLKFPKLISEAVTATVKTGVFSRMKGAELPTAPFSAPNTPLNGLVASQRKWNTVILSLERIKALKNIMGTTMNDVMLAICAGALRRYLLEKEKWKEGESIFGLLKVKAQRWKVKKAKKAEEAEEATAGEQKSEAAGAKPKEESAEKKK